MKQITNLKLREVAKLIDWKDVSEALKFHYQVSVGKNYTKLFKRIQNTKNKRVNAKEELEVYASNCKWDFGDIDSYYGIHIKKKGEKMSYSMSFQGWDKLCNLKVADDSMNHYTMVDIVTHFMWEITFYGNEAEAKKTWKMVNGRAEEVIKKIKNERNNNSVRRGRNTHLESKRTGKRKA